MAKIVIVEDDEKLSQELEIFLIRNGYETEGLRQFDHVLEQLQEMHPDLVLLDLNLPDTDGTYILKEFRKVSDVPVIMITSRDSDMDELLAMHYGADHYVTKPFNTQILLAKIIAIMKRTNQAVITDKMNCGSFVLDIGKSRLETDDRSVELTANELKIMRFLAKNKGKIVSRDDIMDTLWEDESFIDDNTLTVNMTRIRKKLQELGMEHVIETKRGQGYMMV